MPFVPVVSCCLADCAGACHSTAAVAAVATVVCSCCLCWLVLVQVTAPEVQEAYTSELPSSRLYGVLSTAQHAVPFGLLQLFV
jgi:hypothetical protein